jgi:hypothetical protein
MRKVSPLLDQYYLANVQIILFLSERLKAPDGLSIKQQDDVAYLGLALLDRFKNLGRDSQLLQEAAQRFATQQSAKEKISRVLKKVSGNQSSEAETSDYSFETGAGFQKPKRQERKKSQSEGALYSAADDSNLVLRSIYRKLASALHPDRSTNEIEREQKTTLMARVNAANDRGDLSALIHLQNRVISVDSKRKLSPERLQAFARELRQQCEQLRAEQRILEKNIRDEFSLGYGAINKKTLKVAARAELSGLQQNLDSLANTLQYIQTHRNFKNWIKQQLQFFEE